MLFAVVPTPLAEPWNTQALFEFEPPTITSSYPSPFTSPAPATSLPSWSLALPVSVVAAVVESELTSPSYT